MFQEMCELGQREDEDEIEEELERRHPRHTSDTGIAPAESRHEGSLEGQAGAWSTYHDTMVLPRTLVDERHGQSVSSHLAAMIQPVGFLE